MFAEADSRSAMEGRRAAHRGTFGTDSGLGGAKASSITTGKDARREEEREKLLALQKQPAAMRALRDAMLLEGKVTQSE